MNVDRDAPTPIAIRWLVSLALALAVASFLFEGVLRPAGGGLRGFLDFAPYYRGTVALRRGLDPYDLETTDRIGEELGVTEAPGFRYLYPPIFAFLTTPLARLPYPAAKAAWYVASLLAFALALRLLPGAVCDAPTPQERRLVLFLSATLLPIVETLRLGQVNLILLLLVVLGLRLARARRPSLAGAAFGLAAAIKGTPILLLAPFARRGSWRVFATALAVAAGLTAVGFALAPAGSFASFCDLVLPWYGNGHSWVANQSPQGFLLRALAGASSPVGPSPLDAETSAAAWASRAIALLLLAGLAYALSRGRRASLPLRFALALATMPLVSAITWVHHLALLLPAFAALFLHLGLGKRPSPATGVGAIAAFVLVALPLGYDHPAMRAPLLLPFVSTKLLGTSILWVLLFRSVVAAPSAAQGSG